MIKLLTDRRVGKRARADRAGETEILKGAKEQEKTSTSVLGNSDGAIT
jgi:hypothetical protein